MQDRRLAFNNNMYSMYLQLCAKTFFVAILVIRAKMKFLLPISKYVSDERIEGIFCVRRKPVNFCHPGYTRLLYIELSLE